MTPTMVLRDGRPVLALGGSGGFRIPTGVAQVLLAHIAFDRPIASAVGDPRIDTPPLGGLTIDPFAPQDVIADLARRGEAVDATKPSFSAVSAIAIGEIDGARVLAPAADPRKGGTTAVE
jgi:gamma-glutamyltranspeptidase/glutathione hydrolase